MTLETTRDASPSLRPAYINTMVDDLATLDTRVDSLEAGGGGGGGGTGTVGPRGPAGPTGATGATGPRGATGATGATGAAGSAGATGPAGPGVPTGGNTGQILAKTSGANYATGWIDPPTGTGGAGGDSTTVSVTLVTEDYTLQLSDAGKVVEGDTTSAGFMVFIPTDDAVAFPIGTVIEIDNVGPNPLNIVSSGSVTLQYHSAGNHQLTNQFEAATIRKRATDTWIAVGALS